MNFSSNQIEKYLQKPAILFSADDIVRYIEDHGIEMLNFRYVAEDGQLKVINFVVNDRDQIEQLLRNGERVDGSSIFSFLEPHKSDLYLVPRYQTAFVNPFSTPSAVDVICSFFGADGQPLESSPQHILHKAKNQFLKDTGMQLKMMAELEYYVMSDETVSGKYLENGYQNAEPFARHEALRTEALKLIAQCGGNIRFGHAETGRFALDGVYYEQHELEFALSDPEKVADQLVVAKWILRMLSKKYNVRVTFIPKIALGQSGNGLHYHFVAWQNERNMLIEQGEPSSVSLKLISGLLELAPALCAFGNPTPVSYLRTLPGEKAPGHICWGLQNRSALIRIPLGWDENSCLADKINPPGEQDVKPVFPIQTVEYRGADCGADPYLFSAALIAGFLRGWHDNQAQHRAGQFYCDENLFKQTPEKIADTYQQLPNSCAEAADHLEKLREVFETDHIFPKAIINHLILKLRAFNDRGMTGNFITYGEGAEMKELIDRFLHST